MNHIINYDELESVVVQHELASSCFLKGRKSLTVRTTINFVITTVFIVTWKSEDSPELYTFNSLKSAIKKYNELCFS